MCSWATNPTPKKKMITSMVFIPCFTLMTSIYSWKPGGFKLLLLMWWWSKEGLPAKVIAPDALKRWQEPHAWKVSTHGSKFSNLIGTKRFTLGSTHTAYPWKYEVLTDRRDMLLLAVKSAMAFRFINFSSCLTFYSPNAGKEERRKKNLQMCDWYCKDTKFVLFNFPFLFSFSFSFSFFYFIYLSIYFLPY